VKVDILFAQFPGQYQTQPSAADWVAEAFAEAKADPRFGRVVKTRLVGTPIPALRNRACLTAIQEKFDYIVQVDSDMYPDMCGKGWPSDKRFFKSSFDFIFGRHLHAPCVIAAPYVGPPPYENIYVFRWRNKESGHPNVDWSLEGYTREEAAILGGIQRCAAIPTGVCIIDVRGLPYVQKPWFYYGYRDEHEADVVMTEDVAFSRNWGMSAAPNYGLDFMPVYCNWDAWACHWKMKMCGKPVILTEDDVSSAYRRAAKSGFRKGERLIVLGETPFSKAPVYRGESLHYSYSDQPNDARGMANVIPACCRGEFCEADVFTRGSVIAPENNLVATESRDEVKIRVPKYETEGDLVAGRGIDYDSAISVEEYHREVEFPSDPLSSGYSELRDAFPPAKDRSAICPEESDLPHSFCLKPRKS
jgi:hypothetical protein